LLDLRGLFLIRERRGKRKGERGKEGRKGRGGCRACVGMGPLNGYSGPDTGPVHTTRVHGTRVSFYTPVFTARELG